MSIPEMIEPEDPRLRLCVVTDDLRDGVAGLVARVLSAERGGASMVVLRLKHAEAQTLVEAGRALIAAVQVPVLVSDRLDVALACGAAGVHLAAGSMPVVAVRSQMPSGMLVGASVAAIDEVFAARGADFLTIGPVFGVGDAAIGIAMFRQLVEECGTPSLALGGVSAENASLVRAAGASGLAAIGSVLAAADPGGAARDLLRGWDRGGKQDLDATKPLTT